MHLNLCAISYMLRLIVVLIYSFCTKLIANQRNLCVCVYDSLALFIK